MFRPTTKLVACPEETSSLPSMSDTQLLELCTRYGTQAKLWKQKFLGLLPEVEQRKLYLQTGCTSIFEFAAKVGGVSREQVLLVLRLEKRFEITPRLHQALTTGSVPVSKLSKIASVATAENQGFILNPTHLLSTRALETMVKDIKYTKGVHVNASNPNRTIYSVQKVVQSHELNLAIDVKQQFLDLQNKGIDVNQVLREVLAQRKERIQKEKQELAEEPARKSAKPSRYIPTQTKRVLREEYGTKCARRGCTNLAVNIHHKLRFANDPAHNPVFMVPLCKPRHEIAHTVDVRATEHRLWRR
mgnify:FL=1